VVIDLVIKARFLSQTTKWHTRKKPALLRYFSPKLWPYRHYTTYQIYLN